MQKGSMREGIKVKGRHKHQQKSWPTRELSRQWDHYSPMGRAASNTVGIIRPPKSMQKSHIIMRLQPCIFNHPYIVATFEIRSSQRRCWWIQYSVALDLTTICDNNHSCGRRVSTTKPYSRPRNNVVFANGERIMTLWCLVVVQVCSRLLHQSEKEKGYEGFAIVGVRVPPES